MDAKKYEESLRKLKPKVYMFGKRVENVVDDPIIRPSMEAVAYLTESMHGAGSPQAQRIMILSEVNMEQRKKRARVLCGMDGVEWFSS